MKYLQVLLFCLFSYYCNAQIDYEKGYILFTTGEKKECLIRNMDWINNPKLVEYKYQESANVMTGNTSSIKEFGIFGKSKYKSEDVQFNVSKTTNNDSSSSSKKDIFKGSVFLKEVLTGSARLYQYTDGEINQFFFKKNNDQIENLVYEKYVSEDDNKIYKDESYKSQLSEKLNCNGLSSKQVNYNKNSLISYFVKYNQCADSNYKYTSTDKDYSQFNIYVTPLVNFSSLNYNNPVTRDQVDFGSKVTFGGGLFLEYIMPFNKGKWAIIAEPSYGSFSADKVYEDIYRRGYNNKASVNYKYIELPIGIKHYFFVSPKSKIFLAARYVPVFDSDSNLDINDSSGISFLNLKIKSTPSLNFGVGFNYNNTWNAEIRLNTARSISRDANISSSSFQNISLAIGYNLLK